MNFIKLDDLPIYDLYSEMQKLIANKSIQFPESISQICLNTINENSNDVVLGTGSLWYDWEKTKTVVDDFGNKKIVTHKREVPLNETDFKFLCSQFVGTLFEEVYNQLQKKYNIGRVRIMKSKPKTCLTWHVDYSYRVHYPMKTQDGCFMIIENEVMHLPVNTWWYTNTLVPHTAMNGSMEDRIHLVVEVLK